jgi:hypothetical protein
MEGITDAMRQYSRSSEDVYANKPKRTKPYGIRTPDTINIVAVLSVLFLAVVLAAEFV